MVITAQLLAAKSLQAALEGEQSLSAQMDVSGGTTDHQKLINKDADDQHPISAITGLQAALNSKLEETEPDSAIDNALAQAKESGNFKGEKGEQGEKCIDNWR